MVFVPGEEVLTTDFIGLKLEGPFGGAVSAGWEAGDTAGWETCATRAGGGFG
jgi:hypothetical protein